MGGRWADGWMDDGRMGGWIHRWMRDSRRMEERMDGWVDGDRDAWVKADLRTSVDM